MKTTLFITLAVILLFTGCTQPQQSKPINTPSEELSLTTHIYNALKNNSAVEEIKNPNLKLPTDINPNQINKYFKMDNIMFALVLRSSMNVHLTLPDDFTSTFVGILTAKQGDSVWTKFAQIIDSEDTNKNNPYYLLVSDQKLLVTIVDQNGAGSGEGIMKVFALSETHDWTPKYCYYFGEHYNEPAVDGDYFVYSTQFSKQTPQPIESCANVHITSIE